MSRSRAESLFQIIVYVIGILMLVKIILMPLAGPIRAATDVGYTQRSFYQSILGKSNAAVEVTMSEDNDEDSKELFELVFKYLTNIEISNPKTYIASQIPILDMLDLSSIIGSDEEPVVVEPPDEEQTPPQENPEPNENNTPPPNEPYVPPSNIDASKPLVLIYHTHTTELYNAGGIYKANFSTDLSLGVARVGQELEKELEVKYGISTLHVTTIHDEPVRDNAYSKSRPTLNSYLKQYPSLKIVIDLHRDAADADKVTAVINGERYARTMFVVGRGNKNMSANLALSNKLNDTFNKLYNGFSRGVVYSKYKSSKYNQDLSPKCVLLEVGSEQSSLKEALNTAKVIARVLSEHIK